jgi:SAM-dependent methyltransferase
MIAVEAHERVLLLTLPQEREVLTLARRLTQGLLVAFGEEERVRAARAVARDLLNVMFVVKDELPLPWGNHFFDVVIETETAWNDLAARAAEVRRVLRATGRLVVPPELASELEALGFERSAEPGPLAVLRPPPVL